MSPLSSIIFKKVELCLYNFLYPGEIPPIEARIEVKHRILERNSSDRSLIVEVQGDYLTSERFERGEKCYVALHQGRAISYIWGARGLVGVEEIGMAIRPSPKEFYLYDALTLAPWRGRNLYPAVLRRSLEDGREEGLERALIFVESGNTASRRGVDKAGFFLFQTLIYKRLLFFARREFTRVADGHTPASFVPRPRSAGCVDARKGDP